MKNKELNKILKDILNEFGFEPQNIAFGMLDSEEHRLAKIEMLSNILDIVLRYQEETYEVDNDE